ncbi:hypothetical protein [Desulfonatronovibrio magnus]|uniref:hypothetical protein n=1 Tax=Desulfonatronovibrio magnus TaxID=698827 RepID=UPI0005EAEC41|nr:hypothetical protein [Desulfonatronovibrio magnus]
MGFFEDLDAGIFSIVYLLLEFSLIIDFSPKAGLETNEDSFILNTGKSRLDNSGRTELFSEHARIVCYTKTFILTA